MSSGLRAIHAHKHGPVLCCPWRIVEVDESLEFLVVGDQDKQRMWGVKLPAFGVPGMYWFPTGLVDVLENSHNHLRAIQLRGLSKKVRQRSTSI